MHETTPRSMLAEDITVTREPEASGGSISASAETSALAVQTTSTDMPASFMMLNKDVRYMIYKILLKSKTSTVRPVEQSKFVGSAGIESDYEYFWSTTESSGISAAICQTNRLIAAESLPVLYGMNTFMFQSNVHGFFQLIGMNRLFVNRVDLEMTTSCNATRERQISLDIWLASACTDGLRYAPNVRYLRIRFSCLSADECKAFNAALIADGSHVVVSLFEAALHSIVELKIPGFPQELVERISNFWKSGEEFVRQPKHDSEKPEPLPAKLLRPVSPHACLSCQECKCAHAKPAQLCELQESLQALHNKLAEGAMIRADDSSMKILQKLSEKFL